MLSAILGDVVGSRYEAVPLIRLAAHAPLVEKDNSFTDDTICTLAIGQWLLEDPSASPGPWLRA